MEQGKRRVCQATLENTAQEPRTVEGSLAVLCDGAELARAPLHCRIAGGRQNVLEQPYDTPKPGDYRLEIKLADAVARQPIYDAKFRATVYSPGLNSAIFPAEEDGNRLHVAKGTVQHFFFVPANHSRKTYEKFDFVLIVPEGVDVIQATGDAIPYYFVPTLKTRQPVERDGKKMVRWVWESDRKLGRRDIEKVRFFATWCAALVPRETVPLGTHRFYFRLEAEGEREREHTGELIVIPEPRGRQPKEVTIGMSGWTLSPTFEFWTKLLATYKKCGLNLMDSHLQVRGQEWVKPVLDCGMRSWALLYWFWWNEEYRKAHPEHAAVTSEGKPDQRMICPEIVASEDSRAIEAVMKPLVEAARNGRIEGTWWDLEGPSSFSVCFCARCLRAFRRAAAASADEELTPLQIQAKYGRQWVDFACQQSARVAARMKSFAKAAGVDWKLAVYCAVQSEHTRRAYRVDWRTLTPHIDVATPSFYSYSPSDLSTSFTRGLTEFAGLVKSVKAIPVWTTLTTGYERGTHYVRDGRLTKMQIIKSIAFGAQGTAQWWWGPVDGRHYQAYAQATSLISELEEFFTRGKRVPNFLSGDQAAGLTLTARRLNEEVLVMLFNDLTGEAKNAVVQVPPGYRIVRHDGRERLGLAGRTVTASVEPLHCRWTVLRERGTRNAERGTATPDAER